MTEVKVVRLEDKEEYVIVDTISIHDIKYIYLCLPNELENENTEISEMVIRKLDKKEKNILGLDTEEEYKVALDAFAKKWSLNKKIEIKG